MKGSTMNYVFCKRTNLEFLDKAMIYGICGKHWTSLIEKMNLMITTNEKLRKEVIALNKAISGNAKRILEPGGDDEVQ